MRRLSIPPRLLRWYRCHTVDALIGATALVVVVALGAGILLQRHPTRASAMAHIAEQARLARYDPEKLQQLHLSDAEIAALNAKPHFAPQLAHVEGYPHTRRLALRRPGDEVALRFVYSEGFFDVSDVLHRVTDEDVDPIDQMEDARSVLGGGPGEAMVGGCCEVGEPRLTVALRAGDPGAPTASWADASEVDLDLRTGALAFTTVGDTPAIVTVPAGRYRLRVSGTGAEEFEQDQERFLIEIWPRTRDTGLHVLRRARER